MTIAGSDSGGGAGIQADLKTFSVLGGFGATVITALTAQNGLGVTGIHAPPPEFVAAQLDAVLTGFPIAAAKTGMLFSAAIIEAVADRLAGTAFPLVVDPVCMSQSGHALLQDDAVEALTARVLPLAALVTPNRPEAERLTGMAIASPADVAEAIRRLLALGAGAVLLKGGHFDKTADVGGRLTDWLGLPGQAPVALPMPRVETEHTHGTGCTLSAAITAGLGQGLGLEDAVVCAQRYLHRCLETAFAPGLGVGPPDHMAPCVCAGE
ncbi:putative phosphomethylpyrimidine kinase [Megalodesulfovibrio gigas DSM 1382 = ATCC 19364]|uniref:hydroxymethylpyrimidine kinase n=1 Tax=Megalodesulfovibrio gigas (strain ATCC 19364 / DSM 1382 / NCIMB 9332 / VKM B-1759) TaxID=1121448 RepID=T2G7X1_MEGG1|nr:putative phosphomethylpyrimidine kinase [Megalodesulfovibrio gigas DSM 1382 = ATCC 19364]